MSRFVLTGLVAFGVWSGGRLSFLHYQSGEACPILGAIPACYIAFAGYLAMAVTLALSLGTSYQPPRWIFWSGLAVAGGLAVLGSLFELVRGDVCPQAFGVPMCYVSLAFSAVIGVLYSRL